MITSLSDLNKLRSAPDLNPHETAKLYLELSKSIDCADWFTVGIMAKSETIAISTLRDLENHLNC